MNHEKVIILTKYPELFKYNPDVLFCLNENTYWNIVQFFQKPAIWRIAAALNKLKDKKVIKPTYPFPCKNKHLIDAMAESIGINLNPDERRPFIYLSRKEIEKQSWAKGWIAVQSSSTSYWTVNKHWISGRMQEVVNYLVKNDIKVVHLGSKDDEPLNNVKDIRGQTSLREAAAILKNCRLFIGLEGGLVHLAKAVDTKSIVIYTGYTTPAETGYSDNINLRDHKAGEGCWNREKCLECQRYAKNISVSKVIKNIRDYG